MGILPRETEGVGEIKFKYEYKCKDCGYSTNSIWKLSICLNCKSKNITVKKVKIKEEM